MTPLVVNIHGQKFTNVKGLWIDQQKTPAPKGLIPLLNKLAAAEQAQADNTISKMPLPSAAAAATSIPGASAPVKLELNLIKLTSAIEKLNKALDKSLKGVPAVPVHRVYEQSKVPTLLEAMGLNTRDFFKGAKNKYGEKQSPGLLRDLTEAVIPLSKVVFSAKDRKRTAVANELRDYEKDIEQKNPTMSTKQINEKVAEKKKELENPKAAAKQALKESKAEAIKVPTGEAERKKSMVQGQSEFASPDLDKKIVSVKIVEIDESVLKKLHGIFGGGKLDNKNDSKGSDGILPPFPIAPAGGGLLAEVATAVRGAASRVIGGAKKSISKVAKAVRGAASRVIGGAKKAAPKVAKAVRGAASRVIGGAKKAAPKVAKAVKGPAKGLLKGLRGGAVPLAVGLEAVDYATGEKALTARNLTGSAGGLAGAAAGAEAGAAGGAAIGAGIGAFGAGVGAIPGAAIGGFIGGVGGAALGYFGGNKIATAGYDMVTDKKDKPKPTTIAKTIKSYEMAKPTGITPQTQALTSTTKRVEAAKDRKPAPAPVIVNNNTSSPTTISNNQGIIGGRTVPDRGSLNLASF